MPPVVAARVSFVVALFMTGWMLKQWGARGRKPHHLAWAAGFSLYAAGTFLEGFATWTDATLRIYYWVAAYMTAAVLGQGSAYIHLRRRTAHALAAVLAVAGLGALAACLLAPLDPGAARPAEGEVSMAMFPGWLRSGTMPFNLYGLALLAGGAGRSVWLYRRRADGARRAWANVCVLLGVLVIGAAGAATKAGAKEILLYAELVGLLFLAAGVYVAG